MPVYVSVEAVSVIAGGNLSDKPVIFEPARPVKFVLKSIAMPVIAPVCVFAEAYEELINVPAVQALASVILIALPVTFGLMTMRPLNVFVPVPEANVFPPAMTTLPLSVFVPVEVLNVPVAEEKSSPPLPAAAVKLRPATKVVEPFSVTAPVPVENVFEPAMTTLPLRVLVSVEVLNVPVADEKSNAPVPAAAVVFWFAA